MDEREFAARVRAAERKLFRVAYALLRNEQDCDDALQEALCKAWLKLSQLREARLFDTWLVRILINECYTLLRKRKRRAAAPVETLADAPRQTARRSTTR